MISARKAGVRPKGNYAKPTPLAYAKSREGSRRYHAMARSRKRFGRRFRLVSRFVRDGDFVRLDCGCIARVVRRGARNTTTRPVTIIDSEKCNLPRMTEAECYFIAADLDAAPLAGYRRFFPGGKRHHNALQFEDGGVNHGVLLDPIELRAQWKDELDAMQDRGYGGEA